MASEAEKWIKPDNLMLIECWTRDGYTNDMVAERLQIVAKTLWVWRKEYPVIEEAMARGREVVDYKVENALLKSALGYSIEEVKTIISGSPDKDGNRPVRLEKTTKEISPNVTAIAIWLNNRKPELWKRNRDNMLELKDDESNITVNIIRHGKNEAQKDNEDNWNVEESKEKEAIASNTNEQKPDENKCSTLAKQSKKGKVIKGGSEEEQWLSEGV